MYVNIFSVQSDACMYNICVSDLLVAFGGFGCLLQEFLLPVLWGKFV